MGIPRYYPLIRLDDLSVSYHAKGDLIMVSNIASAFTQLPRIMKKSPPSAVNVASQILWIADQAGRRLTPMQVLKLSYISHGWTLGLCEKELFEDAVEAWKYGPVVPKVYHKYKRFGYSQVLVRLKDRREMFDEKPYAIINRVVDVYGKYDGLYLSALTHQPDTPWEMAIKEYGENAIIPNEMIMKYYQSFSKKND